MNIGNALGFPAPTAPMKRTNASMVTSDGDAPRTAQSSAQFTAFLNMLVGSDPTLRATLMKQLPENSAGLLDHLLTPGEEIPQGAEGLFSDPTLASATMPSTVMTSAATATAMPAIDAARYSMMTEAARSAEPLPVTIQTPAAEAVVAQTPKTPAINHAERNAIYRQEAESIIASMQTGAGFAMDENGIDSTNAQTRISPALVARVTSGKSSSLEELMAVGDHEGASLRAGLDNVLSKSGTDEGLKLAATHAASIALGEALAASAVDVNTPVKDVEALDPELRSRLERVIGRMKSEYGHDVTIVETARSQERQDMLYAQGRTTPGNIVTQTLDSKHKQGEAVDVLIDGDWNNTQGFARLQQVAKEEGLKTLGMKDPGHLELPKESWTANADVRVTSVTNNGPVSNGVARVATVAQVASVGGGMNIGPVKPEIPAAPQPMNTSAAAVPLPQQRNSNTQTDSQSSPESSSEQSPRKSALKASVKTESHAAPAAYQETSIDAKARFVGPVDELQQPTGVSAANAVDRVHDINTMREQQGAKPLSQLKLEVENADGTSQQIKIDVRGNTVGTEISTDSVSANRLRANANELKTSLESRGLESDSVRISTQNARTTDSADAVKHSSTAERDLMRMSGAGTSGSMNSGDQSAQQGTRDKSSAARDWEDKQASRDEQRAQNRDAQGRGSGNQDRQRPQYQEKK